MPDETIAHFLARLAARSAAPGGGATGALHAAQAAALLAMVARFSDGPRHDAEVVGRVRAAADGLADEALELAEADSAAFEKVTLAYRLPKDTPEDKAARSQAIAEALGGAARPPADLMSAAVRLAGLAEDLLPAANRNVISDIAAAAAAIGAAAVTAQVNIEANIAGIKDEALIAELSGIAALADGVAAQAAELALAGRQPRLAVVTATDDEASAAYVRSIANAAAREGIACDVLRTTTANGITATLAQLGDDPEVHAVMLQTPLPDGALLADLARAIPPAKDVDGASPESLGRLVAGLPAFAPATAEAVLALLDHYQVELLGRHAVVVGRSVVVGKPVAHLLLDRHATVTICHSRTADLPAITRQADVLVAAAGRAGLIGPRHVSPGTTVIDVGTNASADGGLVGEVDPAVAEVAAGLTPVPGGVGPVTTALLLRHVVEAAAAAG